MAEPKRETAVFELPKEHSTSLRCAACADRACEAVGRLPGVMRVACDQNQSQVRVEFDPSRATADEIGARITRYDLEFEQSIAHKAWRVSGLD